MKPLIVKSDPYYFAANRQVGIKLDFLQAALGRYKNPIIEELKFMLHVDCDTGSSGGPARQFPMMLSRVVFQDGAGERCNLKGSSLRIAAHAELSGQYRDGYNIATGQTGATQDVFLPVVPILVQDEKEENDHGILLSDVLAGGSLDVTFGAALTFTNYITFTTSSYVQVWAVIREAKTSSGKVRLAPRWVWKDTEMLQKEDRYDMNGVARWAIAYVGDQTEDDLTAFSAMNVTSDNLEIYAYPTSVFRDNFRFRGFPCQERAAAGAASTEENPFLTGQAFAVIMPRFGQAITELEAFDRVQLNTDQTNWGSNSPQFIRCFYTARAPKLEAAALRKASVGGAAKSIAAGRIADTNTTVGDLAAARLLPVDV